MTSLRPSRREAATGAAALLALSLAGCADDAASPAPATAKEPAEPPVAPSPTATPDGLVGPAGYASEGIVHDPATGLVAVGVRRPNRLLVLDPGSLAVQRTVDVPGTVHHLGVTAAGGTVLVPNEAGDSLTEVDLVTGATRSTPVGHVPHDVAGAPNGDVLVGDEFGRALSVVRDGRVVHRFADLRQPGGVVAAGERAVVVDVGDFTVTSYDLDAMRRVARVPAGAGPTHAALVGPDRVAVADTRGGRLLVFAVEPLREVASLDLGSSPYGLAADPAGGAVWVTLPEDNVVVGVDVAHDVPTVAGRYPTVRQPNTVAVDRGSRALWVASRTDGTVQRIGT